MHLGTKKHNHTWRKNQKRAGIPGSPPVSAVLVEQGPFGVVFRSLLQQGASSG